jgi:hypothetical protein
MAATRAQKCTMEAVRLQTDDFNDVFFKSAASLSHVELSKWCCYRAITCNHGNFRDVYGNFLQVKSIRLQSKISVTKGEAYGLYYAIKQIHELCES